MAKAIYQAEVKVQRINLHESTYPILVSYLNELMIPDKVKSLKEQEISEFNKGNLEGTVKNAIDSFFNNPNSKIEVESNKWKEICQEAKNILTQKKNDISHIRIHVRKYEYQLLLIEKTNEE